MKREEPVRRAQDLSATMSNPRMRDGYEILSPPIESFRYHGDRETPSRNRSPSVGTHRYGKGREGIKAQSHRARKEFNVQPSITYGNSIEPSIDPTWTPIDKRARQKLTFATFGKEKQSKLVWRSKNSPDVGCGFPKRYREDVRVRCPGSMMLNLFFSRLETQRFEVVVRNMIHVMHAKH